MRTIAPCRKSHRLPRNRRAIPHTNASIVTFPCPAKQSSQQGRSQAYENCHLLGKKRKVFLGGSIVLQGLGKYHCFIKDALEKSSDPFTLPQDLHIDGEDIRISDEAFLYQNDDPLLSTSESGIYLKRMSHNAIRQYQAETPGSVAGRGAGGLACGFWRRPAARSRSNTWRDAR